MKYPFEDPNVKAIYDSFPITIQRSCLLLRTLIFDIAAKHAVIGPIKETTRWGEPAYLPFKTKRGSMIRIMHKPKKSYDFGLYFLCNTQLIHHFKDQYPTTFTFGGNRALEFMVNHPLPLAAIEDCMYQALTYYQSEPYIT